jgi:hypothetical protein
MAESTITLMAVKWIANVARDGRVFRIYVGTADPNQQWRAVCDELRGGTWHDAGVAVGRNRDEVIEAVVASALAVPMKNVTAAVAKGNL